MQRIFYLATCDTCRQILKTVAPPATLVRQDIKTEPITPAQLDHLHTLAGSYEALFSKRAQLYRERGLASQALTEADYRRLILEEYTFLRRPVIVLDDQVFVGNTPAVVTAAAAAMAAFKEKGGNDGQ
jgi:arsenate reductase-like glutaredoxin family protein